MPAIPPAASGTHAQTSESLARYRAASTGAPPPSGPPAFVTEALTRDGMDFPRAAAHARFLGVERIDATHDLMAYGLGALGMPFEVCAAACEVAVNAAYAAESPALALQKAGGWPTLFNAWELVQMDLPEPKWLVPGVWPEGVTLLAGKPKFGKSFLSLGLSFAFAAGGKALAKIPVAQCDVLYLFLEGGMAGLKSRIVSLCDGDAKRAEVMLQSAPKGLVFATDWPRGEAGIAALRAYLEAHPATKFVVIDTLQHFRTAPDGKGGGIYQEEYEATTSISKVCRFFGVSAAIVHHASKRQADGAGDVLDLISGSTGLVAGVDNGAVLTNSSSGAILAIVPRELEEVRVSLNRLPRTHAQSGHWEYAGSADDHAASDAQQRILKVIDESPDPLRAPEIAQILEANADSVRAQLHKMQTKRPLPLVEKRGQWWFRAGSSLAEQEAQKEAKAAAEAAIDGDDRTDDGMTPPDAKEPF